MSFHYAADDSPCSQTQGGAAFGLSHVGAPPTFTFSACDHWVVVQFGDAEWHNWKRCTRFRLNSPSVHSVDQSDSDKRSTKGLCLENTEAVAHLKCLKEGKQLQVPEGIAVRFRFCSCEVRGWILWNSLDKLMFGFWISLIWILLSDLIPSPCNGYWDSWVL